MKTPFNGKLNRAATTLAPWFLLLAILGVWQFICSVWQVSDFIFPSPASILQAMVDYAGPITEHASPPSGSPWWALPSPWWSA
jgi:NitT/TauT family transport system permease protein